MIRYQCSGVDVSSRYFDFALTIQRKWHAQRFEQGAEGFENLSNWLAGLGVPRVWVGLEHTGGYEKALAAYLLENGHRVSLLDGLQVLRFKESLGKKSKTDKVDARIIAQFVQQRKPALWIPRSDSYNELLELKNQRESIVESITQWTNRRNAPKTNAFVHAQQDVLIQVLKLQLEQIEAAISGCVASNPEIGRAIKRMTSVTGVAQTTAVAFLSESGPITRKTYPTPESLSLSAGSTPLPWMSGTTLKGTYVRPYGNQKLRRCLNLPASIARRHDPALRLFADRMEKRGKPKPVQNGAIRRKLIHILWAVVVNDQDYDPEKAIWHPKPKNA